MLSRAGPALRSWMSARYRAAQCTPSVTLGLGQVRRASTQELDSRSAQLTNFCKQRGYIFPSSDIYGGYQHTWDLGPLGVQLKKNIKDRWWRDFVERQADCVGMESPIIMHPKVWETAGHVDSFSDPLRECRDCHTRARYNPEDELQCVACGSDNLTSSEDFNMLFTTHVGPVVRAGGQGPARTGAAYLRPETAQGIFSAFPTLQQVMHSPTLPFGVAQVGKAFRNEIAPRNFLFRVREFEQCELEYFCHPDHVDSTFERWEQFCLQWLIDIGLSRDNLRLDNIPADDLAHYSSRTTDIMYKFPHGWGELMGVAHRGDFDLRQHARASGRTMKDKTTGVIPHVIEPSIGVERLLLAVLNDALHEESLEGGTTRTVLRLPFELAPVQIVVLPLARKPAMLELTEHIAQRLSAVARVEVDSKKSIGRRYRRADEAGVPYAVTVDYDSVETGSHVTLRNRDTMAQQTMLIDQVIDRVRRGELS